MRAASMSAAQAGRPSIMSRWRLLALAILASLSWQGLDGILRAREVTRASLDRSTRLATVVT